MFFKPHSILSATIDQWRRKSFSLIMIYSYEDSLLKHENILKILIITPIVKYMYMEAKENIKFVDYENEFSFESDVWFFDWSFPFEPSEDRLNSNRFNTET